MLIRIRWPGWGPDEPARNRLARFRRVLRSALTTRRYGGILTEAGWSTAEAIDRIHSVEAALELLPWIPFREFRETPEEFGNHAAPVDPAPRFKYPFCPAPRIVFFDGSGPLPRLSEEETLAASPRVLREQALRILQGEIPAPRVDHAILSLAGVEDGVLSLQDRDLLWRTFRVPVFEQFLDGDGHVMAGECEAHEGFHVKTEAGTFELHGGELFLTSLVALRRPAIRLGTGFHGEIVTETCPCGRAGLRLRNFRQCEAAAILPVAAGQ